MKKKGLSIFILFALVAMFALTACSERDFASEQRAMGKFQATFHYMGGEASKKTELITFYYPNALLKEPGAKHTGADTINPPTREGYSLVGWYTSCTQQEGQEPIFNEADRWDFNSSRMPNQDLNLYARWKRQFVVEIFYNLKDGEFTQSKMYYVDPSATQFANPGANRPSFASHTLLGYFSDPELTQEVSFPIDLPTDADSLSLYTSWVAGYYTVVRTEDDLLPLGTSGNFYLLNDITITRSWSMPSTFSGTIESANGVTISGINLSMDLSSNTNEAFGLFGTLNNATIKNIKFKDCNVTFTANTGYIKMVYFGLFAGSIENSTLRNLSFENCVLTVNGTANLTINAVAGKINSSETDISYTGNQFSGITILP